MSPTEISVALGLVCWLVTLIVVDSELTKPLRVSLWSWERRHALRRANARPDVQLWLRRHYQPVLTEWMLGWSDVGVPEVPPTWRNKVGYLAGCHLCAGTWVGLGLALVAGGPFDVPLVGWVLSGLLYKAIGHLVLGVQNVLEQQSRSTAGRRH